MLMKKKLQEMSFAPLVKKNDLMLRSNYDLVFQIYPLLRSDYLFCIVVDTFGILFRFKLPLKVSIRIFVSVCVYYLNVRSYLYIILFSLGERNLL